MEFSMLAISPLQHYNKKVSPAALFTAETKSNTNNYMTIKFNNTPSSKKKTVAEVSHDDVQPHPEKIVVAPRLQNDATPTATVTPEVGKLTVIVEESRQDLSTHRHSPRKNMGADRDRQGAQKDLHHSARKLRKTKRRLFLEAVNNIDTSSQAAYYKKSPFRNSTRSRRTGGKE